MKGKEKLWISWLKTRIWCADVRLVSPNAAFTDLAGLASDCNGSVEAGKMLLADECLYWCGIINVLLMSPWMPASCLAPRSVVGRLTPVVRTWPESEGLTSRQVHLRSGAERERDPAPAPGLGWSALASGQSVTTLRKYHPSPLFTIHHLPSSRPDLVRFQLGGVTFRTLSYTQMFCCYIFVGLSAKKFDTDTLLMIQTWPESPRVV